MAHSLTRPLLLLVLAVVLSAALAYSAGAALAPSTASAHKNGCHISKTCPSDHATYRWRGFLCVSPSSPKRNTSFHESVRWGPYLYYCKR